MPTITGELLTGACSEVSGGRRILVPSTQGNLDAAFLAECEGTDERQGNGTVFCCPSGVTASSGESSGGGGIVATVVDTVRAGWESLTAKQQAVGSEGTASDPITQAVDQAIDKQVQDQEQVTTQQAATMSPMTKILIIGGVSTVVLGGLYLFYRSTRS